MSDLQIVYHPHPALRWKSREITRIDADLKAMIARMFELMYEHRGIGLAANQVALPYRMFVINPSGDPERREEEVVFINPEITRRNGSEESEEGCLSLPEIYGPVPRAGRIVVDAFDIDGEQFEMELSGLDARVVQHELDHLDGVLFPDRVSPGTLKQIQPMIDALADEYHRRQQRGEIPSNAELQKRLRELEQMRTG